MRRQLLKGEDLMRLKAIEMKVDCILETVQAQQTESLDVQKLNSIDSEWITLRQACELLGASYSRKTIQTRPELQPCLGRGVKIGRCKCWTRTQIAEWLAARTPEQKAAYRKKYAEEVSI